MNDVDRLIVTNVTLDLPFDDAQLRSLSDASDLGQAALLLGNDDSAIEFWYDGFRGTGSAMARVLARSVNRDDVADAIDAALVDDPSVLADLMRAGIAWSHEDLPTLLERSETRVPAAWMLAQTMPDVLEAWLDGERTPDEVVDVARAAAFVGGGALFDACLEWFEPLAADERAQSLLESSLFLMDSARWSRHYLRGDLSAAFLADWVAVADILTVAGSSYFSAMLGALREDPGAFEGMARLAVAGAGARLAMGPDGDISLVAAAMDEEAFELLATHPAFRVATVLADDDDLLLPAILEAAASDLLFASGDGSSGIGGFPLSSAYPGALEIRAALELLREKDDDPGDDLFIVATLADLAQLAPFDPELFKPLVEAAQERVDDERLSVSRAAKLVVEPPTIAQLAEIAAGEDIRAYAAAEALARYTNEEAAEALVRLWSQTGSLLRAPLYSALLYDTIHEL